MRVRAYSVFEIVAWPAAVWCGIEVALRTATGTFDGIAMTAALGSLAALTIVACRMRTAQLTPAPTRD